MKMVEIQLDKKRVLKFGTKAFVEIEKELDTTMDKIDLERQETLFVLLYAGLLHMDRKLTLDKVYDIVDNLIDETADEENVPFMEAYGKVMSIIGEKIGKALGEDKEKPTEE